MVTSNTSPVIKAATRRVLPFLLGIALLLFQLAHFYVNWEHQQVPANIGFYNIPSGYLSFLPSPDELKTLATQTGKHQELTLSREQMAINIRLNTLHVALPLPKGTDSESFFVDFGRRLQKITADNRKEDLDKGLSALAPIAFNGWSLIGESWIKPLDIISLLTLAIILAVSLTGRRSVHSVAERIVLPLIVVVLMTFQLSYLVMHRSRYQPLVAEGLYTVPAKSIRFLPQPDELRKLAVQIGERQKSDLSGKRIEIDIAHHILRIALPLPQTENAQSFFVDFKQQLQKRISFKWNNRQKRLRTNETSLSPISFTGWSINHELWAKPLDVVSLLVLLVVLSVWAAGNRMRRPDGS